MNFKRVWVKKHFKASGLLDNPPVHQEGEPSQYELRGHGLSGFVTECTKIAHRHSLAIFTADPGIAGNSAVEISFNLPILIAEKIAVR